MKKLFGLWRARIFLLAIWVFALGEAYGATTRTWTGNAAGANSLWLTSTNWSNTNAPVAGDALVFPTNVTKLQVTNDFAANTDFDSFTLSNSYVLRGNALDLSNGVKVAAIGSAPVIHINLRLLAVALAACPFDVDAQAQLSITNLNLNGRAASMQGDGDITINGVVSGTGAASAMNKDGAGTLRLNRANTYSGTTTVSNGTLVVNGVISNLTLFTGTTLAGTGTVGSVSVTGTTTIVPGDSGLGILKVTGAMALNATTTLQLTMNDSVPGVTLDQLRCSSNINLGSAKLSITKAPGLVPLANTAFVILSNTTATAITGTFAGLPEGTITNIGGVEFQISYAGGDGNDVTLTTVPTTWSWDGGAIANTNWSNATNWSGNVLPRPEDILFFPPNVPGRTNFADFTNGFPVHHITIGQANYLIQGTNELVVRSYFEATNASGAVNFFPPLRVSSNPTIISNIAGGTLNLNGPVRLTGAVGVFAPEGTMVVNGSISASQTTFKRSPGVLRLANSNAMGLSFEIEEGTVTMLHNSALNPAASPVAVSPGARLELLDGRILSNPLSLAGTLFAGGNGASNHISGQISLDAPATIDVASNSWLTLAANVINTNGITKIGQGTLELNATHDYTGPTFVNDGTVLLAGTATGSKAAISANATLVGFGAIGSLTNRAGGTVIVGRTNAPGRLTVSSGVTLTAGSTVRFRIDGNVAGSGYSQITVNGGTVALNNATLNLALNFTPAAGASFVLIDNAGAGATTGTFAGLPHGAKITNGATVLQISYTGGTGNDVVLTVPVPGGGAAPSNLRLDTLGPRPSEITVRWDPPTSGPVPVYYVVYRDGFKAARLQASLLIIYPFFYDAKVTAGHTYTYEVRAEYADGSFSAPSNPFTVAALPAMPQFGTNRVVTILARLPEFPSQPFATSQVDAMMFTATNSVRAYMEEVSYGKYSITNSTYGWFTLPSPAENYCAAMSNGLWYFCDDLEIVNDLYSVVPASISNLMTTADVLQVVVHGRGPVDEAGETVRVYSATNDFTARKIIHQVGHYLGFLHSSALAGCTGYTLEPDIILATNNCSATLLGDIYDPMGASEVFHYNGFFKEKAGWLGSNNVRWITNDGDYVLHPIEKKTNAIQVLKLDLGGEMFWFLEYRTIAGFDGPTFTNRSIAATNGLLMRLRVARCADAESDTFLTFPVITTNASWFDAVSGLRVNLLSTSNGVATVRITGLDYVLRLISAKRTGPNLNLTWESLPGTSYFVQSRDNDTPWQTVATNLEATGSVRSVTLTNAITNFMRFFRVGAAP
jgi:autotransporter-associated beta strand protein